MQQVVPEKINLRSSANLNSFKNIKKIKPSVNNYSNYKNYGMYKEDSTFKNIQVKPKKA